MTSLFELLSPSGHLGELSATFGLLPIFERLRIPIQAGYQKSIAARAHGSTPSTLDSRGSRPREQVPRPGRRLAA
jgi:hypothetical protein